MKLRVVLKALILLFIMIFGFAFQSYAEPIQGPTLGRISSFYGTRTDPFYGHKANHMGLDIAAPGGTPVYAMQEGFVSFSSKKGGYGNCVMIDHFFYNVPELPKVSTLYGHMSKVYVKKGEMVQRGQVVGLIGSTGRSTGPHLHFEVLYQGRNIDPLEYLQKLPSYLEYANYARKNRKFISQR